MHSGSTLAERCIVDGLPFDLGSSRDNGRNLLRSKLKGASIQSGCRNQLRMIEVTGAIHGLASFVTRPQTGLEFRTRMTPFMNVT